MQKDKNPAPSKQDGKKEKQPGESLPKSNKKGKETVHPKVIDERLLLEQARQYNRENDILIRGDVILQQVTNISLSFLNIWKIQNLTSLEKLQYLRLDNNIIENIENLGHLKNLKWLDLSFNCIKEIQGLEQLVNLQDISLYNNQIEVMQGLDNCSQLNVLSIGNNKIKSADMIVQYFQFDRSKGLKFKNLEVLNVDGNPFTKDPDFQNSMISSLPGLQYLDYQFIDSSEREKIKLQMDEQFSQEMDQEQYYKLLDNLLQQEKEKETDLKNQRAARMDELDKIQEELTTSDLETIKVIKKDAIEDEIRKFKEKIKEAVDEMKAKVLKENAKIMSNKQNFEKALRSREVISEKETIKILQRFEHEKKIAFRNYEIQIEKLQDEQEPDHQELLSLNEKLTNLKNQLMDVEIQLLDEIETAMGNFDSKLKLDQSSMIDPIIDEGFGRIQKYIGEFNVKLGDICQQQQDKYHNDTNIQQNNAQNDDGEINEEQEMRQELLGNKENLTQMISGIKDALNDTGTKKQTEVSQKITKDNSLYVADIKLKQYERNRQNVKQITEQIEVYVKQIQKLLTKNDSDDEA